MHLRKPLVLIISAIIIAGCKKQSVSATDPGDCAETRSASDGDIIQGRYIVAYRPASVDGRAMSSETIFRVSENVLERNNIDASAVAASFTGEPGGFIATLTAEQVAS